MRRFGLVLAVVVAAVLAGCGDDDEPVAAGPGSTGIADPSEWVSVAVTEDGADRPLVDDTRIDLRFADGQLGARAGCNHLFGDYALDGDTLEVGQMGGTEMGCPPELHDQDQWLTSFLTSAPAVEATADGFTLTSGATSIRFVDRETAEPDAELVGPTWEVTGFVDGETAMSTTAGSGTASARFDADGVVHVDDGCNELTWGYEREGSTLRFTPGSGTDVGCEADDQRRIRALFDAGSATVELEGQGMTLLAADGRGVTFSAG